MMTMKMRALVSSLSICALMRTAPICAQPEPSDFFATSDRCIACHSGLTSASGQDVSIGYSWRASMMANSARDPYWHAGVRRETMDHPAARAAIEDKCSTCHMPMARYEAASRGGLGVVFDNLRDETTGAPHPFAFDGVSCTVCHQITNDNFGATESFTGGFVIDPATSFGERRVYGPHEVDVGLTTLMQSAGRFVPSAGEQLKESELCATCHTLFTETLNDAGEELGEFPEQVPYLEWLASDFRDTRSCQDCHMPELDEDTPISSVLGEPRPAFSQHVFRGGNAFMLGILNEHRGALGVTALPQELEASIRRTRAFLGTETADLDVTVASRSASSLELDVAVENLAGHKLPSAYPSRRVWLHVTVTGPNGELVFESGAVRPDGSIVGNDNDGDGTQFEPHYERIEGEDQVQIYEPIIVDYRDRVTTGLLYGLRYIKDNRLLPRGFDKASAPADVAVHGSAIDDRDFAGGGDRVHYSISVPPGLATLRVSAELLYQTIGYRWASNLRDYDSAETNRFVAIYEGSAEHSAVRLALATLELAAD
jgi:hypothetical protein